MKLPTVLHQFKKRRYLVLVVILLLIIFSFAARANNQKPKYQFTEVKRQNIQSSISASGTLNGQNTVNLRFGSSGKLAFLNVKVGDSVKEGDNLAGLDAAQLALNLSQARNTLRDRQATADKIIDDIHLFQYGNQGTKGETETQRAARTTAEVARDNAVEAVKSSQKALSDTYIIAPVTGIVTKSDVVPGQIVSPADTIAQIVTDERILFDADIDEADLGKVSLGQRANISLDAYPDQNIVGVVEQILPATKTTTSGATVITVRINIDNAPINFVAGLSGQVDIINGESVNSLTIPQESLRDDDTVVVKTNSGYEERKVQTGLKSDTDIEIKDGLKDGDLVVTNPPVPGTKLN
jgi:RND family efflux transporter MFP subunit